MQKNHYSEDISLFYGIKVDNNDITQGAAYSEFVAQVGALIKKGRISVDEANRAFLCMKLSYGENNLTFDKKLFDVFCSSELTEQITKPRPFWVVVEDRKQFGEFVFGLYGDFSSDVTVQYLSSMDKLVVVLVTDTEKVFTYEGLEVSHEIKYFTIIKKDN